MAARLTSNTVACKAIDPQDVKMQECSALSVAELVDAYMADGPALKPEKKAASWKSDRGLFDCHVKPLIGRMLARDVTKIDVAKLQMDIAEGLRRPAT